MLNVIESSTPTLNEERMPNLTLETPTKEPTLREVLKKVNGVFENSKEGRKERKLYAKHLKEMDLLKRKRDKEYELLESDMFVYELSSILFSERTLPDAEEIEMGAAEKPRKGSLLDRLMALEDAVKFKFETLAEQLKDINELNFSIGKDLNELSKGLKKKKKYRTSKLNHWTCPVLQFTKAGDFVQRWDNLHQINDTTSFNGNAIAENLKKATNSSQGYVWEAVM